MKAIEQLETERRTLERDPANADRIAEINKQLETERTLLNSLTLADTDNASHKNAIAEASELTRLALENVHESGKAGAHETLGRIAENRGRLTALTIALRDMIKFLVKP